MIVRSEPITDGPTRSPGRPPNCQDGCALGAGAGEAGWLSGGGIWALLGPLFQQWPWTAFVGTDPESARNNPVDYAHIDQVMDYVLPLKPADRCQIGDTVAFPVYAQAQMSRAYTVAVSGVQSGQPMIEGIFDHAATMLDEHLVPLPIETARERIDHTVARLHPRPES